jgi:NitT/TauT family transport system substrate-binding protein
MAAALAALAVGCGGDDEPASKNERTTLTVQVLPISDVVPVYLGQKKGFFSKRGIDLKLQTAQGGAEIVPLVLNGSVQIGYSNTPSLFIAAVRGLPLQIVAPADGGVPRELQDPKGTDQVEAIMVRKDSPIRRPEDLAGKTIAVNTLKNISEVATRAALEKHRVDDSTVKWFEVPLPDMLATLDARRVDAAYIVAPFKTIGEQTGRYRSVLFPQIDTRPGMVNTAYFTSRKWAEENRDVLDRFLAGLRESMDYAEGHDAEMRRTIGEYAKVPPAVLPEMPIGARKPACGELRPSSERLAGLMVKYGALSEMPDLDELIRPDFCEGSR